MVSRRSYTKKKKNPNARVTKSTRRSTGHARTRVRRIFTNISQISFFLNTTFVRFTDDDDERETFIAVQCILGTNRVAGAVSDLTSSFLVIRFHLCGGSSLPAYDAHCVRCPPTTRNITVPTTLVFRDRL